jgi:alpha,alpha-trehalase
MKIAKTLLVAVSLVSVLSTVNSQSIYKPKHAESWNKVEKFAHENWYTSKVDVKNIEWFRDKGIIPPHNFMAIAAGHPTLFYWDNYFTNKALLLIDSLSIYAKQVTDNLLWEVDSLGFVPNSNMHWGMNRSQSPYLAMMVNEVYQKFRDKDWLKNAYSTLKKEYHFWTDTSANAYEDHRTAITGLQRYYFNSSDEELEILYASCYARDLLDVHPDSIGRADKLRIAGYYAAEAAASMDFTPRFENRCPEFVAVDLNANLYKYEELFAYFVKELGMKNEPNWRKKAIFRKKQLNKYCWNEKRGMYMDYDFVNKRFSNVAAITCMSPLVMGIASKKQAAKTVSNLGLFEYEYGITVCEPNESGREYQWDYPAGWPPVFQLTTEALHNYGYTNDALRVSQKYLDLVTRNFLNPSPATYMRKNQSITRLPGYIYEKYDVVSGGINDREYPAKAFIGWSAGTYIWCLDYYRKYAR